LQATGRVPVAFHALALMQILFQALDGYVNVQSTIAVILVLSYAPTSLHLPNTILNKEW
jgi:hypothetical protein